MDAIYDWIYRAFVLGELRFYYRLPVLLFVMFPVIIWVYVLFSRRRKWRVSYSVTSILSRIPKARRTIMPSRHLPMICRLMVLVFVILAAMRPQMGHTYETITTEGIDIILTLDISSSMLAEDFEPNRIEAAKVVMADFVSKNQNDRIGLVIFSGMAFTQCPLTTDTTILEEIIDNVELGDVLQGGTAIGDAILVSVNRISKSDAPTRMIILLTDGEHNWGEFDPDVASGIAARTGVRIYTIGVGGEEPMPIPDPDNPGNFIRDYYGNIQYTELDEETLQNIADKTGGRYFRATDETALARIYDEIAQLETYEIESHKFTTYTEIYQWFLLAALFFFLLELLARHYWERVMP